MAKQLQLRKGTSAEHNTFTGANGEVTVDTTNKTLRVHDGSTVGGTMLVTYAHPPALPGATTSTEGIVRLNDTRTSTSTTQALTAAQGKVLNDQAFGIGQTWQDVTASRALGTTYTNTTGKPIFVVVSGNPSNLPETLILTIGGVVVWKQNIDGENYETNVVVSGIVPSFSPYSVTTDGNNTTISRWVELRPII